MTPPGWVDLQVNGFVGVDFSSSTLTLAEIEHAGEALAARGTAAFLAALITCPMDVYRRNLPLLAAAAQGPRLKGRLLGVHLEGPFLNAAPGAIGVHPAEHVRQPEVEVLDELLDAGRGTVRLLTVAADAQGVEAVIQRAVLRGVRVSLGHHLAGPAQLRAAAAAGATALTHLGNGLPQLLHRHQNPIFAALDEDALCAMVIPDGHHLPKALLRTIARIKGRTGVIAVSDAAPIAGLPPGSYQFAGTEVVLEPSGRIFAPGPGCLAGAACTLADAAAHLLSLGFGAEDIVAAARENPLRYLGRKDGATS